MVTRNIQICFETHSVIDVVEIPFLEFMKLHYTVTIIDPCSPFHLRKSIKILQLFVTNIRYSDAIIAHC